MSSILFVDDDSSLLEGLKMRLRRLAGRWDMEFVDSGSHAIAQLEQRQFDAVITDMRMPGMDGAELLAAISTRWPDVLRIVLSGDSDLGETARLVPVAQHCLGKPCEVAWLEEAVERSLRLRELLRAPRLRTLTAAMSRLSRLPPLLEQLQVALARRTIIESDVVRIISSNPAVAAKMLVLANSVYLHNDRPVTSVDQAVRALGFTTVRNFALAAEVLGLFGSNVGQERLEVARLHDHVEKVAMAVSALAAGTAQREDALLAALLHDVGYLALREAYPAQLEQAKNVALLERISMCEAEKRIFGISHAQIGAYLLNSWGLPHCVVEAVAHHHAPQEVKQTRFDILATLAVAHCLVGSGDADAFGMTRAAEVELDESYLRLLHAPFNWSEAVKRTTADAAATRLSA